MKKLIQNHKGGIITDRKSLKKTCKTTIRIVSLHNKSPFRDTEWPFRVTEWPFRVTEWSFRVTEQTFKYSFKEK